MGNKDREQHRLYMAQYRIAHPDRSKESKAYYETHREQILAKARTPEHLAKARKQKRQWHAANPDALRRQHLRNYGMTMEAYDELVASQGGGCYFCGQMETKARNGVRRLSVDHDHETGQTRGAICIACNISLGYAERGRISRLCADPAKLSAYLGKRVEVLTHPRNQRAEQITAMWQDGIDTKVIAAQFSITPSRVGQILAESITVRVDSW